MDETWFQNRPAKRVREHRSSHTRCHAATSTIDKLVDYGLHTPEDPLRSAACLQQRSDLISRNQEYLRSHSMVND